MEKRLIIGSDHGGFELKEAIKSHLIKGSQYEVLDAGVYDRSPSDYPPIAHRVVEGILKGGFQRGILICGTGIGMSITANRYRGIRAALCHDHYTARYSRLHNDANVLVLGGRVLGVGLALEIVDVFLNTEFEGGRHERRLCLIEEYEESKRERS
ncbi:MAG: ribose 5-phosphate isomerase B [Desulfatiglandales bacterium]